MFLTKEGREGGLVSYLLILFLLRKYRLWDIPLLTKKYVVFSPSKALHQLYFFLSFSFQLLLLGFSVLVAVFMFPQLNVHIITSVDPTKLVALAFHKFWLKDVGTNMCVPQYPFLIFPPKVPTQLSSKVRGLQLAIFVWGFGV